MAERTAPRGLRALFGGAQTAELEEARTRIADLETQLAAAKAAADRRHFVQDYNALVRDLIAKHPLDEAMSIAIGGSYDEIGPMLVQLLVDCGLRDGMSIVDLGCGSGRIAKYIGKRMHDVEYLGIDVVPELLDYARSQTPEHFRFVLNHELAIPAPDNSADFLFAFSVFTHLLHEESIIYLDHARRVVRPGGLIVFTILEMQASWPIFGVTYQTLKNGGKNPHLNMFVEREQIALWAKHLDLDVVSLDAGEPHNGHGQTVVILKVPEAKDTPVPV